MILKTLAIEETEKEKRHTPIKKVTPTMMPIHRLLMVVSWDSIRQARNVAVIHTGQGIESQRKVFLERSHPQDSHSLFVFIPKYTSPIAMIRCIVTPAARIFCVISGAITPTKQLSTIEAIK